MPKVVSKEEIDDLIKQGYAPIFRGMKYMDKKQKELLNKLLARADHNIVAICGNSLCYEIEGMPEYDNEIQWGEVVDSIIRDPDYQTDVDNMHLFIKNK